MNEELKSYLKNELLISENKVSNLTQNLGFYSSGFDFIDACISPEGLFPRGAITEIMGLKSTCKTTLVLHALSESIRSSKEKPVIWWADFEGQLSNMSIYAQALGVDINADNFIHRTPAYLEDGCSEILQAIKTGSLDFIIIDSNASMRPKKEDEEKLGEMRQKGLRGFLISEFCRNLVGNINLLSNKGMKLPAIIIINQLYQKLNIGGIPSSIPIYDSPGSESIKFYAGVRIELKLKGFESREFINQYTFEKEKIKVCSFVDLFVEKSKVCIPHKRVNFAVRYGEGIDIVMCFLKAAINAGIIKKKGSSSRLFYLSPDGKESQSFNGFFSLYDFLRQNTNILYDLAKHEKLKIWLKTLKSRIPMIDYAKSIMNSQIQFIPDSSSVEGEVIKEESILDL